MMPTMMASMGILWLGSPCLAEDPLARERLQTAAQRVVSTVLPSAREQLADLQDKCELVAAEELFRGAFWNDASAPPSRNVAMIIRCFS